MSRPDAPSPFPERSGLSTVGPIGAAPQAPLALRRLTRALAILVGAPWRRRQTRGGLS